MDEELLHPPGKQYPEGEVLDSGRIPRDLDIQRGYLEQLFKLLKPWQAAELVRALQIEAGETPQEFPAELYPQRSREKRKASGEVEEVQEEEGKQSDQLDIIEYDLTRDGGGEQL